MAKNFPKLIKEKNPYKSKKLKHQLGYTHTHNTHTHYSQIAEKQT